MKLDEVSQEELDEDDLAPGLYLVRFGEGYTWTTLRFESGWKHLMLDKLFGNTPTEAYGPLP